MNRRHPFSVCALLAAAAATIAGCAKPDFGSALGDPPPPAQPEPPTPSGKPIVYLADQDTPGVPELYLVRSGTPGVTQKINPPLIAGGGIFSFGLSADLQQVVYTAFQDRADALELYIVGLDDPGTATRLNAPLGDGDVQYFQISPGGSQVAYAAHPDGAAKPELYLADIAAPGVAAKLGSELPTGSRDAASIVFSPDGTAFLFAADQDVGGQFELFLIDSGAPATAVRINGPMTVGGSIYPFAADTGPFSDGFGFSPDGTTVIYIADQDVDEVYELYAVDVNSPGASTKLNGSLAANGDVRRFAVSPDSTRVAYAADQDADERLELYLVDLGTDVRSATLHARASTG